MDEEDTAGFREPCTECAAVDWGVSEEGRFFCRSCHNVIERTKEVVDTSFNVTFSKVTNMRRGPRNKEPEQGFPWMVCEGFQFILLNQADALLRLGVGSHFKDEVLRQLWRLYLQRSRQAYVRDPGPGSATRLRGVVSDTDSMVDSCTSASESGPLSYVSTDQEGVSDWSGSTDGGAYRRGRRRRNHKLMSMKKTLALLHLALVWSREALTLSDLLRLVRDGFVPYVNAHEQLPEWMKLYGKDAFLFQVEEVPAHHVVHRKAQALAVFLQLPAFPPITAQSLLHPAPLSLRYLMDANLPDELHPWVCALTERAGLAEPARLTFHPRTRPLLPQYDVQAAALIIVTMKVVFGLDDHIEWDLSNHTGLRDDAGEQFHLRTWYKLLEAALARARQKREQDLARKQWKSKKPVYDRKLEKCRIIQKKRTAEQLRSCFQKLSSCPVEVQGDAPSSFTFRWGDEDGSDGPSLHHLKLGGVVTVRRCVQSPLNRCYWHPALKPCCHWSCVSHLSEVEATLPRSFTWLLQLFSFLLDLQPCYLYEEVLAVERRVFGPKTPPEDSDLDLNHLEPRGRPRPRPRRRARGSPRGVGRARAGAGPQRLHSPGSLL
ncbi:TATA box-binding protein-associated factor RNA polymerase I subunit B [Cololabis saira]|uniref:TATA box-binding protein-associated factor RNA polymerase I subunit B n=1 Tax=Cololabis saira TaxID=129043 RepID=UPI002AD2574C|nr:TATA box-binding protein-associated factor RNA polymerase I subunit B [Cololabis saira]